MPVKLDASKALLVEMTLLMVLLLTLPLVRILQKVLMAKLTL
jgi:hypothetical protein